MKRFTFLFVIIILSFATFSACNDGGTENDPATDGDTTDGDASDGDTEDGDVDHFSYSSCVDISDALQYPTPQWETVGDTPTGVLLSPPANDFGAALLKDERESWFDQLSMIDGFALMLDAFVALDGEATAADTANIKFFRWNGDSITNIEITGLTADISEDGKTLAIGMRLPLPVPEDGDRYILAVYDGAVTGAGAIPACDGESAHSDYVDAADALVAAGEGDSLQLALPFTPSQRTKAHRKLAEYLEVNPILNVTNVILIDDYQTLDEEFQPDAETQAVIADHAYHVEMEQPAYQDADGIIQLDEDGLPVPQGTTNPGLSVILPANGVAPYPVIVFQHGGSMSKFNAFNIVKPYAELGFAMIGTDLPFHGDRSGFEGEGGDMAKMADFDSPLASRDNFLQASADHLAVITGIGLLNGFLETAGEAANLLDPDRVFYIGHSMGSISGTLTSGVADGLLGTSLIAGGAPFKLLLSDGLYSLMLMTILNGRPKVESKLLMAYLQTLMDGGDPVNFPSKLENHDMRPKDVLVWEIIDDPVAINRATDLQALTFGTVLASPPNHSVDNMAEQAGTVLSTFSWEDGGETAMRVHYQYDAPDVATNDKHLEILINPLSHLHAAPCFAARAEGGYCEVSFE